MFQPIDYILIIAIIILTIALRALPGILGLFKGDSGDENYHLLCADRIGENNHKIPERLRGFILPGIFDYPPLYHYILSFVPKTTRELFAPFYSGIIDALHVTIIYLFTYYLFSLPLFSSYQLNPSVISATSSLLFATSPALLYYGIGPRAYHATPRTLGELLITVTFLLMLLFYISGNLPFLLISSLFVVLVVLCGKFSTQVLTLFTVIFTIALSDPVLALVPVIGFVSGVVLCRNIFLNSFLGWIKHVNFLRSIAQERDRSNISSNNIFANYKSISSNTLIKLMVSIYISIYNLIINNTYAIFIIRNIMLVLLFAWSLFNIDLLLYNRANLFLSVWIIASMVTFVITSPRSFQFMGEAERYIEYSIAPQIILFTFLVTANTLTIILYIYFAYAILFYVYNVTLMYVLYKMKYHVRKDHQSKLFNWLSENSIKNKNVLSIPDDPYTIAYRTDNNVLFSSGVLTSMNKSLYTSVWEEILWPNRNLTALVAKYDIEYIIVNKRKIIESVVKGWNYDLSSFFKVYENDEFTVYDTRG